MASTVSEEKAGNDAYQQGHMSLIFKEGFSFSGFERDGVFLNLEGHTFKDISGVSGLDSILDGRAPVLADLDNDGDHDVFLTTIQEEGHLLFRNNVGHRRNFIRITLEGTLSGKDAFGTQVRVKSAAGIQTKVKAGGSGFLAFHDPRLLFGLGDAAQADSMEILWPSGTRQSVGPIRAGTSLKVVEGEDPIELDEKRFPLPDPEDPSEAAWKLLAVKKGDPLPELPLYDPAKGQSSSDASPLPTGKPYFLNLWATYCGPCRKEMPELQKLYPEFSARGIQLIGVSMDESPQGVNSFAQSLGAEYPILMIDPAHVQRIFSGGRAVIPLSLLVDSQGRVQEAFAGWNADTESGIRRILEK